ncbi:MAG: Hsp20/alpha crystallin family protein [Proteobacteria bacterium]|nr:Hsp20/alpha crystallin family protein [Pseudomonadota bacterium]
MYCLTRRRAPRIWEEMERFNRDWSRFFGGAHGQTRFSSHVFPPINLYDDGESFVVRAEIPGIDKNDLEINATADALSIKGQRKRGSTTENASFHRRERDYGHFDRSLTLPLPINPEKIVASYKLGVLEVVLPKAEEMKPRKVAVEA